MERRSAFPYLCVLAGACGGRMLKPSHDATNAVAAQKMQAFIYNAILYV
jgi:hypothetical protein